MSKKLYVDKTISAKIDLPVVAELFDKPIHTVIAMHLICKPDNSYHIAKLFRRAYADKKWDLKKTRNLQYQNEVSKALRRMEKLNIVIGQRGPRRAIQYRLNPMIFCSEFLLEKPKTGNSLSNLSQSITPTEQVRKTGCVTYNPPIIEDHLKFVSLILKTDSEQAELDLLSRISSVYKEFDYFTLVVYFKEVLTIMERWLFLRRVEMPQTKKALRGLMESCSFIDFKGIEKKVKIEKQCSRIIDNEGNVIGRIPFVEEHSIKKVTEFLDLLVNKAVYVRMLKL